MYDTITRPDLLSGRLFENYILRTIQKVHPFPRLSWRKKLQKRGTVGQNTKPFGFSKLPVPRLSQTVPSWDKIGQFANERANSAVKSTLLNSRVSSLFLSTPSLDAHQPQIDFPLCPAAQFDKTGRGIVSQWAAPLIRYSLDLVSVILNVKMQLS